MEIRSIKTDDFFAHPDAEGLLEHYAIECGLAGLPSPKPDRELYRVLETAGLLSTLAAFDGETMAGFCTLLVGPNAHYSTKLATTESIFVSKPYRSHGAGLRLLAEAEDRARSLGAVGFLVSTPANGAFARVMQGLGSFQHTNEVFLKVLA